MILPTPITEEETWIECLRAARDWTPAEKSTVVVAPHPDDETLGAGGLIAMHRDSQIPVTLLAVTDGEAAYPDEPERSWELGRKRVAEQMAAAEALGVARDSVIRFGMPDSSVASCEAALADRISACIDGDTLLIAPWVRDPHPDHEACGRAAAAAARRTGATLIFYFFWTWHRFRPECLDGLELRRLELSIESRVRRAAALACHGSQLNREEGAPILPEILLAPARRPFEIFSIYGD